MTAPATSRRLILALGMAAALLCAAPAAADEAVAELARDTPIAAYGGVLAWSEFQAAGDRFVLVIRRRGVTAPARAAGASRAFDVSLGPDSRGRVVALYTRCRTATRGCDVYRYDVGARRERRLASVSSPSIDEAWPAQWRDRVTFSRRARTHVVDGVDHRPDPRGRGPLLDCDIPYVKTLSSRAPSRRLDRSRCGATAGMAIRGDTIVHVAGVSQGGAGSESQVRLLRVRGGAARILARAGGGEGGFSPFQSPNLSGAAVFLTRTGQRQGVQQGFLRIDVRTGRLTTVAANLPLAGRVAHDERGRFWYVQGPEPVIGEEGQTPFCRSALEPCRLVRASASPFGSTGRALLPRLSVDGAQNQFIVAFAADPPRLSGALDRAIVRGATIASRSALPGVTVALLQSADEATPGQPVATAATDPAGRWSFAIDRPPPQFALTVLAPALKLAGPVITIRADARITLGASGRTLSGTVAPAQPGRTVQIQRLSVDARGRLPDGRQVCGLPVSPRTCSSEAWATVAQAPLDAGGTAFSATVAQAGDHQAVLSYDVDPRGRALAYGGVSPAVSVP